MKIKTSSRNLMIFLFTVIYFYCNIMSENLFPRRPEIYIITKIVPLFFISIYLLFMRKFYYNPIFKLSLSFYILFFVTASISGLFSEDYYVAFRALFINVCLTLPLFFFFNFINSEEKLDFVIKILTICYLLITFYLIYEELFLRIFETNGFEVYTASKERLDTLGFSKGRVTNIGLLGLTLFLLNKSLFRKLLLIFSTLSITYITLSAKLFILISFFAFLILFLNKKKLAIYSIVLVTIFILFLDFNLILDYLKNNDPIAFAVLIERPLALFGFEDVSNYATVVVNRNILIRTESLELFYNNPFLGIGLENERAIIGTQAHSGFIGILIGTGVFGFIFFYFFIFYILFGSIKVKSNSIFEKRYDKLIIICFMYFLWATMNPVYKDVNSVILMFLAACSFINIKSYQKNNKN